MFKSIINKILFFVLIVSLILNYTFYEEIIEVRESLEIINVENKKIKAHLNFLQEELDFKDKKIYFSLNEIDSLKIELNQLKTKCKIK